MTVLAYGALCRGLLSGKIDENTRFEGDDLRKTDPKFRQTAPGPVHVAAVRALDCVRAATLRQERARSGRTLDPRSGRNHSFVGRAQAERLDHAVDDAMGWSLDAEAMRSDRRHPRIPREKPDRARVRWRRRRQLQQRAP